MKTRLLFVASMAYMASMPALAQVAITTFGATDATQCFENARDQFSKDVGPCNRAIKTRNQLSKKDYLGTLVNRAVILNRAGDLQGALRDLNEALNENGDLAEAYLNRGNSYFFASRFEEALTDYERSIELDVRDKAAAWYNIGLVYIAQKSPDRAREAFENALLAQPGFGPAQKKLDDLS